MESGLDAFLIPEVADRLELSLELGFVLQWFGTRCSKDDKAQMEQLATG